MDVGREGGPLAANCSMQANGKRDMNECRACINIAFKNLKAGNKMGPPQLFVRLMRGAIQIPAYSKYILKLCTRPTLQIWYQNDSFQIVELLCAVIFACFA